MNNIVKTFPACRLCDTNTWGMNEYKNMFEADFYDYIISQF